MPLPKRILVGIAALPDHRWLDRIVRGRAWIPVLGVLLVGVVGIQVEVLKLGASIGRSMNLATVLESRGQLLRADVARLGDDGRIERLASRLGMVMPGPTATHFVSADGPGTVSKAIAHIAPPDPTTFLAGLAAEQTADGTAPARTVATAPAAASSSTTTAGATPTAAPSTSTPGNSTPAGSTPAGSAPSATTPTATTPTPTTGVAPAPAATGVPGSGTAPGTSSGGVGIPTAN